MTEPGQPLTDAELAAIRDRAVSADDPSMEWSYGAFADSAADVPSLLTEVDRLRAENTAQVAKLAEAKYLADGWIRAGSGWSSLNMNQAVKYRALIDCGKALQRALGVGGSSDPAALDQSGEGQANG